MPGGWPGDCRGRSTQAAAAAPRAGGGACVEELFSYSASYGFPMVVAGFLLIRMESKIDKLTVSIYELAKVIAAKL